MDLKTFIEEYNKRADWNSGILEAMHVSDDEMLRMDSLIYGFLDTDKINEDDYYYDSAKIYEDRSGGKPVFELQIYSYTRYSTRIFRLRDESKAEYTERIMNAMINIVAQRVCEIDTDLESLKRERELLAGFLGKIDSVLENSADMPKEEVERIVN